jgi:hypothetical protein
MATQDSPSLYGRLGGIDSIATVIDDFIDRIMIDSRLNANPRVDEAHHRVPCRVQVPRITTASPSTISPLASATPR